MNELNGLDAIWAACRWSNQYLAILAAIFVSYRLTNMALERDRWRTARGLHAFAWFVYIALGLVVGSFAAGHYDGSETPAIWTAGARSVLHLSAITLATWWPHPPTRGPLDREPHAAR